MQAFALSVVLMSSVCGDNPVAMQFHDERNSAAAVGTIDMRPVQTRHMASCTDQRYDSGKGDRHVPPISGRRSATTSQR